MPISTPVFLRTPCYALSFSGGSGGSSLALLTSWLTWETGMGSSGRQDLTSTSVIQTICSSD